MTATPSPDTQEPASPCIGVCQLNPQTKLCDGCYRTIDEIAAWSQYSARQKQAVLAELEARCIAILDGPAGAAG